MKVLKFGGSSVANANTITQVLRIIEKASENEKIAVIVSAFGNTTDTLIKAANYASKADNSYLKLLNDIEDSHFKTIKSLIPIANQSKIIGKVKQIFNHLETICEGCFLLKELTPKTLAKTSSFGELLSSKIIAEAASNQMDAVYKDSRELIIASDNFLKALVNFKITHSNINDFFNTHPHKVTILPGFIAKTLNDDTTTLGRGGSDYSAALYAAALNASELQIWTDVSGIYTANPKLVKQAYAIKNVSYQEAMELSHFGAKVIYAPTIKPVLQKEIPTLIKNTFKPQDSGTLITKETSKNRIVNGISHIDNIALVTLEGIDMVGIPGVSKRLFEALSANDINVILITQASSELSICIAIDAHLADAAKHAINDAFHIDIVSKKIKPVLIETQLSIIALVGDNMKNHQGLSGKMFSTLGNNNVNVRAIAQGASEKNISAVINKADTKKALNTLHERFFEAQLKQLNLFIVGVGNVGQRFLEQLHQQQAFLKEHLKLNIRIIGLSNSKNMIFNEEGISTKSWQDELANGEIANLEAFYNKVNALNMRNSVFVDITASDNVSRMYLHYIAKSIAVVTCNKIACASHLKNYKALKMASRQYNVPFLYETNVGAGLPIIDTLKNLVISGDRVHKIQAVLSGSLNFIFNTFNAGTNFHDVVMQAQQQGFTEPDPKIDLSGVDVARKILILARESGYELDLDDVKNISFLPKEVLDAPDSKRFFEALKHHESTFQDLYKNADKNNCRLKYVANLYNGKANVQLTEIASDHPFYHIEESDNIVLFYTKRYSKQPLIIKGAGAGADVTASGIFADIIRTGNVKS